MRGCMRCSSGAEALADPFHDAMRFEGILKTWNDDRGFGFIEPRLGGQEVFVHIKAFESRAGRPQVGQPFSFEVELNPAGKKRALRVQPVRAARPVRPRQQRGPAHWGTASYFAIPAFLGVYLAAAAVWRVPGWAAALYAAMSVVCYIVYAGDKSAAMAGRSRVPESTLLLLGLAGGWPGAIVAQQVLRHKSNKVAFRAAFWGSVVMNVLAFVALSSPYFRSLIA